MRKTKERAGAADKDPPHSPDIALGLAYVEYYNNNANESKKIVQTLEKHKTIPGVYMSEIDKLKKLLQTNKVE